MPENARAPWPSSRQAVPKNKKSNRVGSDGCEGRIQLELRRRALPCRQSPQIDGEMAGRRHRLFAALGARTAPVHQGAHRRILRLPPHEAPDELEQRMPDRAVAAAIDAPITRFAAALADPRTQAGVTSDLAAILETRPVQNLPREHDPGERTDAARERGRCRGFEFRAHGAFCASA